MHIHTTYTSSYNMHTYAHHAHVHIHAHTYMHAYTTHHMRTHMWTQTHVHTNMHMHTCTHTTCTHICGHTHMHTQHMHTHTCTRTPHHAYTCTHAFRQLLPRVRMFSSGTLSFLEQMADVSFWHYGMFGTM